MSRRTILHVIAFALNAAVSGGMSSAGCFVQPALSGTTFSGLEWSAVATGTALPVRTSATNPLNGTAGAVVYVNMDNGLIQFDPKGLSISTFILTYTTGSVNIGDATPGPFQYLTGTGRFSFSSEVGSTCTERTFPELAAGGIGGSAGTYASRLALSSAAPLASLAIGDCPCRASTDGSWDLPWAFPPDLVISGSVSSLAIQYFRTTGQAASLNANVLGYGSQQGVFQYVVGGIPGNQLGAVIPVFVPEPSTACSLAAGLAIATLRIARRRRA